MTAARYLGRAHALSKAVPMSDRTDAIVSALAMIIEEIIRTSPDDQADTVRNLARIMRR